MAGLTVEQKAAKEAVARAAMMKELMDEMLPKLRAEVISQHLSEQQARPPSERIEEVKNDAALRQEIMSGEYAEVIISGGEAGKKSITLSVQGQVNRYECGKAVLMPFPFFDAMKNMTYQQGAWDETGHKTDSFVQRINFQMLRNGISSVEARATIEHNNQKLAA